MAIFSRRSSRTKPLNVQPSATVVAEGKHVRPPVETSAQAEVWRDNRIMEFGSELLKLAE